MKKLIIAVTLALGSLAAGEIVMKVAGIEPKALPVMKVAGIEPKALPLVDEDTTKLRVLQAAAMVYQKHCEPALSKARLATLNESERLMGAWRGNLDNTAGTQLWIEQVQWSADPQGWCASTGREISEELIKLNTLLVQH